MIKIRDLGLQIVSRWLVALKTTEAVVMGSNPATLTVEKLYEDRKSHCVYYRIGWVERQWADY